MKFIFLFIFIFTTLFSMAQQKSALMLNSRKISEDRYPDIKGSPYLFENWKNGRTLSIESKVMDSVKFNYNGFTHMMEARQGDSYIEFDVFQYPLFILYADDGSELFFKRDLSNKLMNRYPRVVHNATDFSIVQDFSVTVETIQINDVGQIRKTKTFVGRDNYYLMQDGKAKFLKLRKKNVLKLLGHSKELEGFMKQAKLKLNSEESLITLLKYYDEQGYTNY